MTKCWSIAGLGVCFLAGCGAGTSAQSRRGTPDEAKRASLRPATSVAKTEPDLPSLGAHRAGVGRANELAAPPDDRFTVTRQVTALERAIELYETFIERAGDDPRYAEAVRRSRARIDDARLTICFLLEKPCDGSEIR